jgi:aryl-alcohol dehydrogenase-like predicted oxidoreductase
VASCEASLRRLQTDVIDLYQIHWPERHVPPSARCTTTRPRKLRDPDPRTAGGAGRLVQQGKIRHVGLSNETPYGVHEFVRLAEQHGLPRVASVQNPYCLLNRSWENGWTKPATAWVWPAGLFAAGLRPADRQVRRHGHRRRRMPPQAALPSTNRCASSAGAAPRRWPPRRYNALARSTA